MLKKESDACTMIVCMPRFWKWQFVVYWYTPIPWWKLWRGYKLGIVGPQWPTLYFGPLKVVTGPAHREPKGDDRG